MNTRTLWVLLFAAVGMNVGAVEVCTGSIVSNVLLDERNPATLEEAKEELPCGLTYADSENCLHDCALGDCAIGVGHCTTADWVLFEWTSKDGQGGQPLPSECQAVMESRVPCGCWGFQGTRPAIDCPDPISSDEDGILEGGGVELLTEQQAAEAGWAPACRSYALMPTGADARTPARGFFAVGGVMPIERYQWEGIDEGGSFGAISALQQGAFGPILLGHVTESPLWGDENGHVATDWEWLKEQGVCLWPQGTHLGSPYWINTVRVGARNFPVLVRCDAPETSGLNLFGQRDARGEKLTPETWPGTGTLATELVPMMQEGGKYELVCVTKDVADRRRSERREERD